MLIFLPYTSGGLGVSPNLGGVGGIPPSWAKPTSNTLRGVWGVSPPYSRVHISLYLVAAFIVFDISRHTTFEAVAKWKQDLDNKVSI